jgi:hypothetical protein
VAGGGTGLADLIQDVRPWRERVEHLYDGGMETSEVRRIGARRRFVVRPPEEDDAMTRQLTLIPARKTWQLDAQTREVGRRGIAEARAALAAHKPADHDRRSAA